jgi:hypothetical protein
VSAIASFTKLPKSSIEALRAAAIPKKRLFGSPKDVYWDFVREHGVEVAKYRWSGYVMAAVIPYLTEKHGINLSSELSDLGSFLSEQRRSSFFPLTLIMRLVRAEMLEVLRTDYIKFARARGLSDRSVHFGHALKNTLVPVITIAGLQLGGIIAFAIITEQVFQWPGMGLLFIQAVQFADIPVMAAYLCLIGLIFVVINLVVDLLYYLVDPRLRIERGGAGGGGGH